MVLVVATAASTLGNDVYALYTSIGARRFGRYCSHRKKCRQIARWRATAVPCGATKPASTSNSARDGVRQTMIGFKTQADAEAWIVRDAQFPAGFACSGATVEPTICRTAQPRPEGESEIDVERLDSLIASALASNSSANARSFGSTS